MRAFILDFPFDLFNDILFQMKIYFTLAFDFFCHRIAISLATGFFFVALTLFAFHGSCLQFDFYFLSSSALIVAGIDLFDCCFAF